MRAGALCEIGNIVINAVLGTISNALDVELSFTLPLYLEGGAAALVGEIRLPRQGIVLLVKTTFEVKDLSINGDIVMFLTLESFESLSRRLKDRAVTPR
jgi:chemotaxis protein CheC